MLIKSDIIHVFPVQYCFLYLLFCNDNFLCNLSLKYPLKIHEIFMNVQISTFLLDLLVYLHSLECVIPIHIPVFIGINNSKGYYTVYFVSTLISTCFSNFKVVIIEFAKYIISNIQLFYK